VAPPRLHGHRSVLRVRVERVQTEPLRSAPPGRRGIDQHHRRRTVPVREQCREQPDDPGTGDDDVPPAHPVGE